MCLSFSLSYQHTHMHALTRARTHIHTTYTKRERERNVLTRFSVTSAINTRTLWLFLRFLNDYQGHGE